ncbi:MAG: hypothetical protein PHO41_06885 [Eubacteriales bacterium]|nr:hypothetical protein [Eubacteriales bacterium]
MIKVTVSYERPEELEAVLTRLGSVVQNVKLHQGGKYKKAYLILTGEPNPLKKLGQRDIIRT